MTGDRRIREIVVAGNGTVGLSAAALLKHRMPGATVTLVGAATPPAALADRIASILPSIVGFHDDLGLSEEKVLRAGASFRLGTLFEGWAGSRAAYVHAYGEVGQQFGTTPFHLHWARLARGGEAPLFDSHSPAAVMARAGRFVRPQGGEGNPLGSFEYGLNLDPARYRDVLRAHARALGVIERAGAIADVRLAAANGFVEALILDDGSEIGGHLFVDCTGPSALVRSRLDDRFEDWGRWLPCDRVLFAEGPGTRQPSPLDKAVAHAAGWRWESVCRASSSHGLVYSAAHLSDAEASAMLHGAAALDPAAAIAFRQGRRSQPWFRNCVAVGDAAVSIEPLEWANLHLAHSALDRLVAKMPDRECAPVELWDYNRECAAEAERVRDFLVLHYAASDRPEDGFWRDAAAAAPPDSLAHTLGLFRERGRLPLYEEETFTRDSWATVLLGQGVLPRRDDPMIGPFPPEQSEQTMRRIRDDLAAIVSGLPASGDALSQFPDLPEAESPPMTTESADNRIRTIVVVGGGTAGWMAAAAMGRFMNNGYTRTIVVESEEIGIVGVGEATIPPILNFNRMLGINENEFLKATNGTFKLGVEFVNWGRIGDRYFHPFGTYGTELHGVNFHQLWLRERARRPMPDLSEYSMSSMAAMQGKMGRPAAGAQSAIKDITYAFHFDASLYGKFLRTHAENAGVTRIEGKIVETILNPGNGHVDAIRLASGQVVEGDLFIDCSGFRGLLIEQALETGYEDWTHWLPCDRAYAVPSANPEAIAPFTRATALRSGWQWRIPLQNRTGNGIVYSSNYLSDDEAVATLLSNLEGEALDEPRQVKFTTGRRKLSWNRNVVAMGLASGFIEPLESTSIHLVQNAIAHLIALFPDRRFLDVERDEFNRVMKAKYEDVRNFIVLHYNATQRDDSPFWDYCRTMTVPEELSRTIDLWKAKGRNFREGYDLFGITSWVAVLLGQHIWPDGYDPAADALDENRVADVMEQIRTAYARTAEALPSQREFIERIMQA